MSLLQRVLPRRSVLTPQPSSLIPTESQPVDPVFAEVCNSIINVGIEPSAATDRSDSASITSTQPVSTYKSAYDQFRAPTVPVMSNRRSLTRTNAQLSPISLKHIVKPPNTMPPLAPRPLQTPTGNSAIFDAFDQSPSQSAMSSVVNSPMISPMLAGSAFASQTQRTQMGITRSSANDGFALPVAGVSSLNSLNRSNSNSSSSQPATPSSMQVRIAEFPATTAHAVEHQSTSAESQKNASSPAKPVGRRRKSDTEPAAAANKRSKKATAAAANSQNMGNDFADYRVPVAAAPTSSVDVSPAHLLTLVTEMTAQIDELQRRQQTLLNAVQQSFKPQPPVASSFEDTMTQWQALGFRIMTALAKSDIVLPDKTAPPRSTFAASALARPSSPESSVTVLESMRAKRRAPSPASPSAQDQVHASEPMQQPASALKAFKLPSATTKRMAMRQAVRASRENSERIAVNVSFSMPLEAPPTPSSTTSPQPNAVRSVLRRTSSIAPMTPEEEAEAIKTRQESARRQRERVNQMLRCDEMLLRPLASATEQTEPDSAADAEDESESAPAIVPVPVSVPAPMPIPATLQPKRVDAPAQPQLPSQVIRKGRVQLFEAAPERVNPCRFWLANGKCNKGASCSFSHDGTPRAPRPFGVCTFFARNACSKGDDCHFAHGEEAARRIPCREFHINRNCKATDCQWSHEQLTREELSRFRDFDSRQSSSRPAPAEVTPSLALQAAFDPSLFAHVMTSESLPQRDNEETEEVREPIESNQNEVDAIPDENAADEFQFSFLH